MSRYRVLIVEDDNVMLRLAKNWMISNYLSIMKKPCCRAI